jgi:hypothetical protein
MRHIPEIAKVYKPTTNATQQILQMQNLRTIHEKKFPKIMHNYRVNIPPSL